MVAIPVSVVGQIFSGENCGHQPHEGDDDEIDEPEPVKLEGKAERAESVDHFGGTSLLIAVGVALDEYENAKYYLPIVDKTGEARKTPILTGYENKCGSLREVRSKVEAEYIKEKILQSNGNLTRASLLLGISNRQLRNKIADYDLKEWVEKLRE